MAFKPPPVTKLELDDDIKNAVNGALEAGHPIVMGYVGDSGYPRLSFRGSTQVYGPQQLAIWVRKPGGRIPEGDRRAPEGVAALPEPQRDARVPLVHGPDSDRPVGERQRLRERAKERAGAGSGEARRRSDHKSRSYWRYPLEVAAVQ